MKTGKHTIIFSGLLLAILTFTISFDSAFAQSPNAPPPNFKVAFIGDQGANSASESVLQLIKNEGTNLV